LVQRAVAEQSGRGTCALSQRGTGSGLKIKSIASKLAPTGPGRSRNWLTPRFPCRSKLAPGGVPTIASFLAIHPFLILHRLRTVRNMIYCVQHYAVRGFQPSANKLSTHPPTANGDKCQMTRNFLHRNQRKSVTYTEAGF
jgi:hypothetical protein